MLPSQALDEMAHDVPAEAPPPADGPAAPARLPLPAIPSRLLPPNKREETSAAGRHLGTIKSYDAVKGFGFIVSDGAHDGLDGDLFCHRSELPAGPS